MCYKNIARTLHPDDNSFTHTLMGHFTGTEGQSYDDYHGASAATLTNIIHHVIPEKRGSDQTKQTGVHIYGKYCMHVEFM